MPRSCKDPPTSLWDRAYDALRESDRQLVERYEGLLSKELQAIGVYSLRAVYSISSFPQARSTANPPGTQMGSPKEPAVLLAM